MVDQTDGEPTGEAQSAEQHLGRWSIFSYGAGHMLNDITAACWFTYLLLFLTEIGLQPRCISVLWLYVLSLKMMWLLFSSLFTHVDHVSVFISCISDVISSRGFLVMYMHLLVYFEGFGSNLVQISIRALVRLSLIQMLIIEVHLYLKLNREDHCLQKQIMDLISNQFYH